ncbi:aldo/keto reductase [Micromonospora sagamiensis]|nr:aldo/keto reductase [Micromonospora sagamiensis]
MAGRPMSTCGPPRRQSRPRRPRREHPRLAAADDRRRLRHRRLPPVDGGYAARRFPPSASAAARHTEDKETLMQYSVLGATGVKVSRICLGTATFGVAPTAQDADRVVGGAVDLGINFVDTADVYGNMPVFDRPGAPAAADREPAEQILGRALRGRRDQMVIATKSNGIVGLDINDRGLSRRHIIRQVETSLRRLETDYIDLYYAHDPDPDTPLEQTLAAYDDLIRQGKIRYVGLSNHPAWQVTHALWIADDRRQQAPVAAQVKYNLIDRAAERELAPACQQFGLSLVPYAPLHGGLLADLGVLDRDVAGDQRFGAAGFTEAEIAVGREVDRLGRAWGLAPYQVSLAWLLSRPAVASAIVGAETLDELRANATAADVELEPAQLDSLTELASAPAAFDHRAGRGPERPPSTTDPVSTD